MKLIEDLNNYIPFNEQERVDQHEIIRHLRSTKDVFLRKNLNAHMTASAWVVNQSKSKVLLIHHNLYNSWSWLGGHADGDTDLLAVAIKEVQEESGVTRVTALSNSIFSIEILTVDGHQKRGQYIPSHLHLNITYLLEVDENDSLSIKEDENSDVAWFNLNDAISASSEPWFQTHIYSKLNKKLAQFKEDYDKHTQ